MTCSCVSKIPLPLLLLVLLVLLVMSSSSSPSPPVKIQDGFIFLSNFLSEEEQLHVANLSLQMDERFKRVGAGNRFRIYDVIHQYPDHEFISGLADRALRRCTEHFDEDAQEPPTHLLFLKYVDVAKIGMHRDDGENDGVGLSPVISFSVGNACKFMYHCYDDGKKKMRSVRLNSGDAILFGGRSRYMLHAVPHIYQHTAPKPIEALIGNARLNMTLRHAPNIIGRESEFYELTQAAVTPFHHGSAAAQTSSSSSLSFA